MLFLKERKRNYSFFHATNDIFEQTFEKKDVSVRKRKK